MSGFNGGLIGKDNLTDQGANRAAIETNINAHYSVF